MSKKTKKQKIQAQLRQKAFLLNLEKNNNNASEIQKKPKKKVSVQADTPAKIDTANQISTYFKKDFTKSLIIISVIIALEIVIYFGTINKYF
jgi:hypothetical protein